MSTSLLALIDDIATILDDVSVMTKVAAKKTTGVLGDDLALNAQQVTGVDASREIPVVMAVAKGSFVNKLILVPIALLLSQFAPMLIQPLLIVGGLFLCYEGFEKVYEKAINYFSKNNSHSAEATLAEKTKPATSEKEKIKGAVKTDFILSAEIIVISLGTVSNEQILKQLLVLSIISVMMTIGVYGLVGGLVKIDDLGFWLMKKTSQLSKKMGWSLIAATPWLMKALGVVGTIAMFLVGGGLISHSIPAIHHLQENMSSLLSMTLDGAIGLACGAVLVALHHAKGLVVKR